VCTAADINELRKAGFGILVKDASLGGQFPVMNVTLLNPRDQGCYVSFGAHPRFDVAIERDVAVILEDIDAADLLLAQSGNAGEHAEQVARAQHVLATAQCTARN
jgi:ribosomal protein S12 methylthiotransferase accessory factor